MTGMSMASIYMAARFEALKLAARSKLLDQAGTSGHFNSGAQCGRRQCKRPALGGPFGAAHATQASNDGSSDSSRSAERRVGQEGVRTCSSRWEPDHEKETNPQFQPVAGCEHVTTNK